MITSSMACPPLRVWFQSIPMALEKRQIMPTVGLKRKIPQHRRPRRCHGVGPDDQGLVGGGAANGPVGHDGQQQGYGHGDGRHRKAENNGHLDRIQINRIGEDIDEVFQADKRGRQPEGILLQDGLVQGLGGRPDEKNQGDDDLGGNQKIGQYLMLKTTRFSIQSSTQGCEKLEFHSVS